MARTDHHKPYDVQVRDAWGDTAPPIDIDPLTGEEWARGVWKGPRADRCRRGVGTIEHLPGVHVGGDNPSKHREFLGRPRIIPTIAEFAYDEAAERAYEAEQRELDELSRDLHDGTLDHDGPMWDECDFCGGPCELWELDY